MYPPPLSGLRIIELAGIGPGPFACMMLADHGVEVIRVERSGGPAGPTIPPEKDILLRSRKTIGIDLKCAEGREVLLDLLRNADGLVEGYRPGVLERLGLAPEELLKVNPRLVIGRMTGWGQTGPMSQMAGHDLNYIAISGALHGVGPKDGKPVIPLNLFGDFGGGGMLLAFGMLAAMIGARTSGRGQVVDAAMTDGSALLMSMIHTFRQIGLWEDRRGVNMLDGGSHFYDTYETADGKHVAVGAIEPQFYANLLERLGLSDDPAFAVQMDPLNWEGQRARLADIFRGRTRDEWDALLMGTDTCYAPILSMEEAVSHPHNRVRGTFTSVAGTVQPAPAPRYSESDTVVPRMFDGTHDTDDVLERIQYSKAQVATLKQRGVVT